MDRRLYARLPRRLDALNAATRRENIDVPGYNFHALLGFSPTKYTVHVNRPSCVTFAFVDGNAEDVSSNTVEGKPMTVARDPERPPTHPGALLGEDILPALGMPIQTAAKQIGVSRQTLHRIIAGTHPVTPAMALRLGKFCGNGPEIWLNMQQAYDLWRAEREIGDEIAKIPTHRAA